MTVTTPTEHTARRQHWCSLCGLPIEPPERYRRWCWFSDGASTIKAHVACDDLRQAAEVWEWDEDGAVIWEIISETPPERLDAVCEGAPAALAETWRQWHEEAHR